VVSGGGIEIKGNKISVTGIINAKGGTGGSGSWAGGGGGGGRIKMFNDASIINTAATDVSGGAKGGNQQVQTQLLSRDYQEQLLQEPG